MKRLMKRMHGGEKGFTLIELLVVIAILGVIAAVVALNVAGFFGRGTLQAANTELHQAQTAIISAMADAESNRWHVAATARPIPWKGESGMVLIETATGNYTDAADYVYGPFRAEYLVDEEGAINGGDSQIEGGWGPTITWNDAYMNWMANPG